MQKRTNTGKSSQDPGSNLNKIKQSHKASVPGDFALISEVLENGVPKNLNQCFAALADITLVSLAARRAGTVPPR
jgi:hypothetical protein